MSSDPTPKARSFIDTLTTLRYGQTVEDLTTELHQLLCAVNRTGRAGKLVLTISVKPADKSGGPSVERIQIYDDVKVVKPTQERGSTFLFLDSQNNPTMHDPRQGRLPLRAVDDVEPIREVSNAS